MSQELHLKRLRYRSGHRGCKETDLILGNFSESRLAGLNPVLLALYERLLDEDDADIWNWLTGKSTPPIAEYEELLAEMKLLMLGA